MQDMAERRQVIKDVFNNEKGKKIIEFFKKFYDVKQPSGNSNMDYFMLGKRKAILEIEELLNSEKKG